MAAACVRSGRAPDAALLVAITKTWPVERLRLIQAAGYDTLGEVFVVLAACIGVLFILGTAPPSHRAPKDSGETGLRHHLVPQVVGRLLIPFIILFGLYVQFHGEYGPGGGFQAGAIIATGLILHALLEGETAALVNYSPDN